MVGQHVGARRHMLAAAEADFEMLRAVVTEQRLGGHRSLGRHRDLRQQAVDQLLLAGAQGLALGAAIKAVEGGRVAGFVSGHGARPSRAARHTASVRIAPARSEAHTSELPSLMRHSSAVFCLKKTNNTPK